jgi:hypothetical protein
MKESRELVRQMAVNAGGPKEGGLCRGGGK